MRITIPTTLHTARLLLRRPQAADAQAYLDVFGDITANAHNPRGFCRDNDAAAGVLAEHISNWDSNGFDIWAVCLRGQPSQVIGFGGLGLRHFDGGERLNLGYGLHVKAWGKGYGFELSTASVQAARDAGWPHDVWARVQRDNLASRKILEKLGMVLERELPASAELWYRLALR